MVVRLGILPKLVPLPSQFREIPKLAPVPYQLWKSPKLVPLILRGAPLQISTSVIAGELDECLLEVLPRTLSVTEPS